MRWVALGALAVVAAGCSHGDRTHVAKAPPAVPQDPYRAAVAYVHCMRRSGFALPDPKKPDGDILLTPKQEARIQRTHKRGEMMGADEECFHFLSATAKTKPLSRAAKTRVKAVLNRFARCMRRDGYVVADPQVRDLSNGRVLMIFTKISPATRRAQGTPEHTRAQRICERGQAKRLDKAIGDER